LDVPCWRFASFRPDQLNAAVAATAAGLIAAAAVSYGMSKHFTANQMIKHLTLEAAWQMALRVNALVLV
jgi:hypothetical protein